MMTMDRTMARHLDGGIFRVLPDEREPSRDLEAAVDLRSSGHHHYFGESRGGPRRYQGREKKANIQGSGAKA